MPGKWVHPNDPNCPGYIKEVVEELEAMEEDPMTAAMGAPVDDFLEGWEKAHLAKCKRCQEFGAANAGVEY